MSPFELAPPEPRLYAARDRSLREIQKHQQPIRQVIEQGEKLVFWFSPFDLVNQKEADLVGAFKELLKRLRADRWPIPTKQEIEAYWLHEHDGETYAKIAARLWPAPAKEGERQAKRAVRRMRDFLDTPAGRMFKRQGFLNRSNDPE